MHRQTRAGTQHEMVGGAAEEAGLPRPRRTCNILLHIISLRTKKRKIISDQSKGSN